MNDKEAKKQYDIQYRLLNKDKISKDRKEYYNKNKDQCNKSHKNFLADFKAKFGVEYDVYKNQKVRDEIFKLLGNKCNNHDCPIPHVKLDVRALQIDHIKGSGNKHRKSFKCMRSYYKKILKEIKSGSKNYQLLCVYCNWMKRYNQNI